MRAVRLAAALLHLAGCAPAGTRTADVDLSPFVADTPLNARIVENSTACIVDAVCFLRLEFADTTIDAIYGTGEHPASPCDIPRDASTAAFRAVVGDIVRVAVTPCAPHRFRLQQLTPIPPPGNGSPAR
jgi:hypothetical protein